MENKIEAQKSSRENTQDLNNLDSRPSNPGPKECIDRCGRLIHPEFIGPLHILGHIAHFSNKWVYESERCSECLLKIKLEEERKKKEREEKLMEIQRNKKIENLKSHIGLRGYEQYTLEKFIPSFNTDKIFKIANSFNPEKDNLYIWGPAGVGKTHIAVGILRKYFEMDIWVNYIKHSALNRSMQGLMGDEYDSTLKHYVYTKLLVVDDLGTAKRTEFSDQVLYDVLDGRYSNMQNGLIITSNVSLGNLADALGDDRLTSRIAGMCMVVKVETDDYRLKNKNGDGK